MQGSLATKSEKTAKQAKDDCECCRVLIESYRMLPWHKLRNYPLYKAASSFHNVQVLGRLLDHLVSDARVDAFLAAREERAKRQHSFHSAMQVEGRVACKSARLERLPASGRPQPGQLLYERFLDVMMQHVAEFQGGLVVLLRSKALRVLRCLCMFLLCPTVSEPCLYPDLWPKPSRRHLDSGWGTAVRLETLLSCILFYLKIRS